MHSKVVPSVSYKSGSPLVIKIAAHAAIFMTSGEAGASPAGSTGEKQTGRLRGRFVFQYLFYPLVLPNCQL
jgi:hypothetical protein